MADFPSYDPQTRTYTPGSFAVFRSKTLSGNQISVRRNNAATGYRLSLSFTSSEVTQQKKIFEHYEIHNRSQSFDLPAKIISNSGFSFPPGYQWIYLEPPKVNFTPGRVTVAVSLELIAPYDI